MTRPRTYASLLAAFLLLHSIVALVSAQGSASRWQTLSGNPPLVVARGGFSGLFPDSSPYAYRLALLVSVPDVVLWCDVQLTKDRVGICSPSLTLDNATDISSIFTNRKKTYPVNGLPTSGWFSVDFSYNELMQSTSLTQGIYSRSDRFNGNSFPIQTVENVTALRPSGLWLNIQHDAFFTQHNMSMRQYVLALSRRSVIDYISSPEVGFLKSIASRVNSKTKLVFRFLGPNEFEPSTNQTYSSFLKNLSSIKTFASGILIPNRYIWPVDTTMYLQPHTTVVLDAHKAGLEVFASEFYNDVPLSYNYSYDPVAEYLNFIDNGDFSVDGVLSDFPITPSAAIDCFSHLGKNASKQADILVISKNGASGDYPGCTDKAYQKAILDGADVIDCAVQMSKDEIPFCLGSINLLDSTSVAQSRYSSLAKIIPELNKGSGIYTFSLLWSEIQSLTPAMSNPFLKYSLLRNPKSKNDGKFLTLSDFLAMAKNASSLSGVLINIENAAYLIEKQQLGVTEAVLDALSKAGFDKPIAIQVMIQSTNSSVLMKFKEKSTYKLVYEVDENIRDALDATIADIKKFAHAVVVKKDSVLSSNELFLTSSTNVVPSFNKHDIPVYAELFSNEFVSQAWDFFSDATVEINSFVAGANVSGVITDFPVTSARYKRNRCLGKDTPYMTPVAAGSLLQLMIPRYLPPAEAPYPVLTEADVAESPLPTGTARGPSSSTGNQTTAAGPTPPNAQPRIAVCLVLSNLAILFTILLLL